jgi:predicted ester cyclase
MTAKQNKALSQRLLDDVWNGKQVDALDTFYAAAYTLNGEPFTVEETKLLLQELFAASPDLQVTLEDSVAEGETVALRWTMRGMNAAAEGQQTIRGMTFYRIVDHKIIEDWYSASPIEG